MSYVSLCLICLTTTYILLSQVESRELAALKNSALLYSSSKISDRTLAVQISSLLHIQIVDLMAPNAGLTVYRLTGSHTAVSPSLVIPHSNGPDIASGSWAISQAILPLTNQDAPVKQGKKALLIMGGLIILAVVFSAEISPLASLLPLPGLVAVAALWGRCLHCSVGGSTLSALAPLLGLGYLGFGLLLFTIPLLRKRLAYDAFLILSGIVPLAQAYMLVTEPKLCPSCLTITFLSAAYFMAASEVTALSRLPGIAAPSWLRVIMPLMLTLMMVRHSLILTGYVTAGTPVEEAVPTVIGSPLKNFLPSTGALQPGLLYLITLDGCHACQQAEHDLRQTSVRWRPVPVCSMATNSGCFDARRMNFPMPMLLMCNSSGRIIYQHEGWEGTAEGLHILQSQVLNLQRRNTLDRKTLVKSSNK